MLEGNFVTFVARDQGVEVRAVLQDDLSQRVLDHLEERKRELAAGLFSGTTSVTEGLGIKKDTHSDEVEDTKLVKKLVKKNCLAEGGIEDRFKSLKSMSSNIKHDLKKNGS